MGILIPSIVAVVFVVILLSLLSNDKFVASFWVTVVAVSIGSYLLGDQVAFIKEIPAHVWVMGALGYIAIGYTFSMIKWVFYVRKAVDYLKKNMDQHGSFRRKFDAIQKVEVDGVVKLERSSEFGATITAWAAWWPFMVILTLFEDVLSNLFNFITESLGKVYQSVLDSFSKQLN